MQPKIKRICVIDGGDPAVYRPNEWDQFAVVLRLFIGPSNSDGEETFDLTVCTPAWLSLACERDDFVIGRHHLIVLAYDFELIRRTLDKFVNRCSGDTWQQIAAKLSRIAYWEFEDYQPSTPD